MIVVGFGGNVGTRAEIGERFGRAREALAVHGRVRSASLYKSSPIGPPQDDFYNTAVALVAPDVLPRELLAITQELELLLGRDRRGAQHWGPRPIDLDLLVGFTVDEPGLVVPHPRIAERRFVLEPLVELVGEAYVLGGRRLGDLLRAVAGQRVELVGDW